MAEPRHSVGCRRPLFSCSWAGVVFGFPLVGSGGFLLLSTNLVVFCMLFILSYAGTCVSGNLYKSNNNNNSDTTEALITFSTAGSMNGSGSERSVDSVLQDYAFRAFRHPRTGIIYDAKVPSNLSGIQVNAVRLRSGSMRRRGILYNEFDIPTGIVVKPYVKRLVLVYQNFVNWSSVYYSRPGFQLVAPVLGLLAYDASNLSATNMQELHITATKKPISIRFTNVSFARGLTPLCIFFDLNGRASLSSVTPPNVCFTIYQGHFSLVVRSLLPTPSPSPSPSPVPTQSPLSPPLHAPSPNPTIVPAPRTETPYITPGPALANPSKKSNTWKIAVGSSFGGIAVFVLLGLMFVGFFKYRERSNIAQMEYQADQSEALQTSMIRGRRAPTAAGTRTQPMLENDYVA